MSYLENINPKVSVIIPMYNVAGTLDRCIHSLFRQSLKEVEFIFVNDSSTDNTLDCLHHLLEDIPQGLSYKILMHEKNRGVSAARNTGLDNATGSFIYFVDADDYIQQDTLERFFVKAQEEHLDIIACDWLLSFKDNERLVCQPDVHSGTDAFIQMCYGKMRWNLWMFFTRRSLYMQNHIRFIEGMNMGEDMMVMMKLMLLTDRVSVIHQPFYHYMQTNEASLTRNFYKYRSQLTSNLEELVDFVSHIHDGKLSEYIDFLKLTLKLPLLISDKEKDFELWKTWFPESNYAVRNIKYLPYRTKILQIAAARGQFWYVKLYYKLLYKIFYGIIYR